jgi:hypothetical protein
MVLLEEKSPEGSVKVNSACRNSIILPLENEAGLKNNLELYSTASIKKLKFKTNAKPDKATYRLIKTELIINESCLAKSDNNPPSIRLQQKIIFENLKTLELIDIESDTLINNQNLNPGQIARPKANYQNYIAPLTEKNFKKAHNFFYKRK